MYLDNYWNYYDFESLLNLEEGPASLIGFGVFLMDCPIHFFL